MSKDIAVLYHSYCPDGCGAALAAHQKFGETAEYFPVSYGGKFDIDQLKGKEVYILDFCFSEQITREIMSISKSLMILDHHKTAEADLQSIPDSVKLFDMSHSGAYLAWKYFNGEPVHEMMLYLEDRDLWHWKLPNSQEINRALQSYGLKDFRVWKPLLEGWDDSWGSILGGATTAKEDLVKEGSAILRQCNAFVSSMVSTAEEIKFEGTPTLAVNATVLFSEVPHELIQKKPPMGIVWCWDGKKGHYQVSLRSEGDFDVSVLAKRYGGGGHKNASGFICKELPWRSTSIS